MSEKDKISGEGDKTLFAFGESVWIVLRAVDCAGGGLGTMLTPVSISAFPVRGYSIAKDVVGVNALAQSPLVVAGRSSSTWEDYNYKSTVGGRADLGIGGRSSDLLIGNQIRTTESHQIKSFHRTATTVLPA